MSLPAPLFVFDFGGGIFCSRPPMNINACITQTRVKNQPLGYKCASLPPQPS